MTNLAIGVGGISREFRVGQVLSKSFSIFGRHFVVFTLVAAIIWLPAGLTGFSFQNAPSAETRRLAPVLVFVLALFFQPLGTAIILYGAFQSMRAQSFRLAEAISHALSRFLPLLGLMLVSTLGSIFGFLLLIVPGLILIVMWYVSVPVCVVERAGPIQSLSRSQQLTKGHRWKLFGLFLLIAILGSIGGGIFPILGGIVGGAVGGLLSQTVWQGIAQAFNGVLIAVAYHDLRVSKEGIDIERIASVFD